jgi:hypothetical protein
LYGAHIAALAPDFDFRHARDHLRDSYGDKEVIRAGIAFVINVRAAHVGERRNRSCDEQNQKES